VTTMAVPKIRDSAGTGRPIIFCHYGNSEYLGYSLQCARSNNPRTEIVLIGDQANRALAVKAGVTHVNFDELDFGDEIRLFDRVYTLVEGKTHFGHRGGRDWVNFVFKRWYYVFNFISSAGVEGFWHFDSDNMILDDLSLHESTFDVYDCTEQCGGICMNGYVSGARVVKAYIDRINDLFQRKEFLRAQQEEFDSVHPGFAFTEMRAYEIFKAEERIKSIRLATIIDGTTFDDCVCVADGMVMEPTRFGGNVKKVVLAADGFYCETQSDHTLIKLNSLNLSWVPVSCFDVVLDHSSKIKHGAVRHSVPPQTLATAPARLKFINDEIRYKYRIIRQRLRNGLTQRWAL
jgi:hypothetical protein